MKCNCTTHPRSPKAPADGTVLYGRLTRKPYSLDDIFKIQWKDGTITEGLNGLDDVYKLATVVSGKYYGG